MLRLTQISEFINKTSKETFINIKQKNGTILTCSPNKCSSKTDGFKQNNLPCRSPRSSVGRGRPDAAAERSVRVRIDHLDVVVVVVRIVAAGNSISETKVIRARTSGHLVLDVDGGQRGSIANGDNSFRSNISHRNHADDLI